MLATGVDTVTHTYAEAGNYEICLTVEEFSLLDTLTGACWSRGHLYQCMRQLRFGYRTEYHLSGDVLAMAPLGSDSFQVFFPDPVIQNTCDRVWTCDFESGDMFPIGTTMVTCTVIDTLAMDTLSCSFDISVMQDTTGMNPCDSVRTVLVGSMPMGDTCCYDLALINNTMTMSLGGIRVEVDEANEIFSFTAADTAWSAQMDNATGGYILIPPNGILPSGTLGTVGRICVDATWFHQTTCL